MQNSSPLMMIIVRDTNLYIGRYKRACKQFNSPVGVNIFLLLYSEDFSLVVILHNDFVKGFLKVTFIQLWIRERLRFLDRACKKRYLLKLQN